MRPFHWGLISLLFLVAAVHILFMMNQPAPQLFGDEVSYLVFAGEDSANATTSLLPGRLRFDHQPQLASRVYSQFVTPGITTDILLRRVSIFNLILLLMLLPITFLQGKYIGLSDGEAFSAAALLSFFPWLGFHVHSLWPEILHAFLFGVMLLAVLVYSHTGHMRYLAVAGVSMGYAVFAKGSVNLFSPVLVVYLAGVSFWMNRNESIRKRGLRAALSLSVFLVSFVAVVGPQVIANMKAGYGLRLAANRWWNFELGLTISTNARDFLVLDERGRWIPKEVVNYMYMTSADSIVERENLSRKRTFDYLNSRSISDIVSAQAHKLAELLVASPSLIPQRQSSFDQALGHRERWGDQPPVWIAMVQTPARIMWYVILLSGLFGLWRTWPENPSRLLLMLLAGYFLVGVLAIPVKIRFLLPLVPVLCLGSGISIHLFISFLRSFRDKRKALEGR